MGISVAVIVPYYHRQSGVLSRALKSVFCQQGDLDLRVIVVDDGSPWPAEAEIQGLRQQDRCRILLLKQRNQGAGIARNAGLDAAPPVDLIAFLDSDDAWEECHLWRAAAAINKGIDFYFGDSRTVGVRLTLFEASGFEAGGHYRICDDPEIYEYKGDFVNALLRLPVLSTSSVVLRNNALRNVRFPDWRMFEDLRFWVDVSIRSARIGFSPHVAVMSDADGVHISHVTDWKTNKSLYRLLAQTTFLRDLRERVPLPHESQNLVAQKLAESRKAFAVTFMAMIKARRLPDSRTVWKFVLGQIHAVMDVASVTPRHAVPVARSAVSDRRSNND